MAGFNTCTYVGPFNTPVELDDSSEGVLTFTEEQHGFNFSFDIVQYVDPASGYYYGMGPSNTEFYSYDPNFKTVSIGCDEGDCSDIKIQSGHINSFTYNTLCNSDFPNTLGKKIWLYTKPPQVNPNFYFPYDNTGQLAYSGNFKDYKDFLQDIVKQEDDRNQVTTETQFYYQNAFNVGLDNTLDSNYLNGDETTLFFKQLTRGDTASTMNDDLFRFIDVVPVWHELECQEDIIQRCLWTKDGESKYFYSFSENSLYPCNCDETEGAVTCKSYDGFMNLQTFNQYCDDAEDPLSCTSSKQEVRYSPRLIATHYAYDIKLGCGDETNPYYDPEVCLNSDDSLYKNYVCPTEDCNGTLIEVCVEDGCSIEDECGQCICGGYIHDQLLNQWISPDRCKFSLEFAEELNFNNNWIEQYAAELCEMDSYETYCIESEKDECGSCIDESQGLLANRDDLGCGCFGISPKWYFLDLDFDCQTDENNSVINQGGTGDDACDVSKAKAFCDYIEPDTIITSETCNFYGSTAGTTDCIFKEYQPDRYVDCNYDINQVFGTNPDTWGELYPNVIDSINENSSCYFDWNNEGYDVSLVGELIEGCMDVNATNYNPDATYGVTQFVCEYEHDIGDVIFRLNYREFYHDLDIESMFARLTTDTASINMDRNLETETFEGVLSFTPGQIINYNFQLSDDNINYQIEGITREVVVKSNIPTYINVEYFNNYTNQLQTNKTNLPILIFSKDTEGVKLITDELDELVNLDGGLIEEMGEYRNLNSADPLVNIPNFNPWTVTKQNFSFESEITDYLGFEGFDWYIDTLIGDETKIKHKLGLYLSSQMEYLYSHDSKFVEVVQNYGQLENITEKSTYRGINLLRDNITESNFTTDDGLYYFSSEYPNYPVTIGGSTLTIDGFDWASGGDPDWDSPAPTLDEDPANFIDVDSFTDWYLLSEVTSTNYKLNNVVYKENGLIKILPIVDFSNSFGVDPLVNVPNPSYWGSYFPVDLSDTSHDGFVFQQIIQNHPPGLESGGVFSLFTLFNLRDQGNKIISRWNELRGDVLNINNINEKIDYYYDYLKNSFRADNKKWRHLDYNNFETYKQVIQNFKTWITNRIQWIDINLYQLGFPSRNYCNDPSAINYEPLSNFNDNSCEYYSDKTLTFQVDTSEVNLPPIERVELEIIKKTDVGTNTSFDNLGVGYTNVLIRYDMTNIRNDIWEIELPITETNSTELYPGDKLEYHFIKHIPQVYTVETGAIEKDKSRFYTITYEKTQTLNHYFNDFVSTLTQTNLPIIKINTTDINDFGFIDDNNKNLFYCPGYIDPLSPVNQVQGWDEDTDECDALKDDIDYFEESNIQRFNYQNANGKYGYFDNKLLCEQLTECETDCIDGTNPQDEPKVRGFMDLIYNGENTLHTPDDKPQLSTVLGIEIRGFSSRGFPKKQYSIELQRKNTPQCDNKNGNYNLFCNGFTPIEDERYDEDCIFTKENDYVLLGPYRDRSYVRNALSYELSRDMGNPASNSKHVEFILNGVYQGIFVMFEKPKIDKTRMDVGDSYGDDGEIQCIDYVEGACEYPMQRYTYQGVDYCCSGGYIIKVESGGEQEFFIMDDGFTKIEYYDPKNPGEVEKEFIRDKVLATQYDTVNRLDTDSFADYVITQELAKNNEGYTRSQYWYVKDTEPDKFYMGYVWDFNHSYGAVKSEVEEFSFKEFFAVGAVWSGYGNQTDVTSLAETFGFLHQEGNLQTLYERWSSYRDGGILDINNLMDRIDNLSEELRLYNAIARDDGRWFYSNQQNYEDDFNYFKTWLLARISWIDSRFKNSPDDWIAAASFWYLDPEWFYNPDLYASFQDDYDRRFIRITSPENNKIYDVENTNSITFNWITSIDLALLSTGHTVVPQTQEFPVNITAGENYLTFTIVDEITGNVIHTFSSTQLYGSDKLSFPSYVWNVSDIDNLAGSYYIEAKYNITDNVVDEIEPGVFDSVSSTTTTISSPRLYFSIQTQSDFQGCTDPFAINFDISSQINDGSCKYQEDCDQKYIVQRTDVEGLRTFSVNEGYNILSYPFAFASEQIDFFDVLNASYISFDGGGFSEYDGITAHFEGNSYSAVFINNEWKSTNTQGFNINKIKPGMGIILELQKSGIITWSTPELGDD